jgi:hypothetical protein
MGTPIAFTSGSTNTFNLGTTKRATIALNPATSLTSGFNWFNGVDVSATQYLIYSDTFSQGQATIANARPTAWTTPDLSDASLLALINTLPDRVGLNGFTDINVALQWLEDSEKYFLIKGGAYNIVTNGLIANLDASWSTSYPGNTSSIATAWTDYASSQQYYSAIGNNGVVLFNTTTNWVGYFPATVSTAGLYTIEFDYVTDSAGTLVLDNDGIVDNEWNANISNTTTLQKYKVTRYIGTTGNIQFFLRRNSGGNHTITNFKFSNTNTWFDLSGTGNHAIITNSPSFNINNGGYFEFDGVDDYAYIPDNASLDLSGNKTHAAWVYMNSSYGGTGLLGKADSSVAGMAFSYGWGGGGFQNIAWNSTNNPSLTAVASDINNWYYIVGVQDGSTRYIYVIGANGTRVVTHDGGTHSWNNSLNYTIGAVAGYYTNMRIGAVHIYNRALSSAEIVQNYNATKSRFSLGGQSLFAGTTLYYDFSKASSYNGGSTMNDLSGNGFNATVSGGNLTTIDGVVAYNCTTTGRVVSGSDFVYGNNYTVFAWARILSDSETSTWRTLFRTQDDDHPLIVEDGSDLLGYFDNNGLNFVSYGLNVGTLGLTNRWVLYTIVGNNGTSQTLYINDGSTNATVNVNCTGEAHDAWGSAGDGSQPFGYISNCIAYNNTALTQAQVKQYYDATKQYYGYTSDNIPSYGLVMNLDAGDPISYPGSGTVWYDTTGNGNNVDLINGPSFVPVTNGGYFVNDADSYFTGSGTGTIPIGNSPYTMLVWVRQTTSGGWGDNGFISIGGFFVTSQSNALRTYNNTLGYLAHYWWGNDILLNNNSAGLSLDTWFLAAATFDGTTRRIWVNGVSMVSDTPTGHNVTSTTIQISKTFDTEYQIGDVAVARIYNRALTSSEMLGIFNTEKSRFGL